MNDNEKTLRELISEVDAEPRECYCTNCAACLTDKKFKDVFLDRQLFEWFGYVFCNMECRDDYINSK